MRARPTRPAFGSHTRPFQAPSTRPRADRAGRRQIRSIECAAPPDGGQGSNGLPSSGRPSTPMDRIKQAILGSTRHPQTPDNASDTATSSPSTTAPTTATSSQTALPTVPLGATSTAATPSPPPERGSWEWWTAYFDGLDDTVRELDGVDEEMEAAVQQEDYGKAAALRKQQRRLEAVDPVAAALDELRVALAEERYGDAAALRDAGGARLLGWWAGKTGPDDHEGHVIALTSDFGRYVAYAYTGMQIAELAGESLFGIGGEDANDRTTLRVDFDEDFSGTGGSESYMSGSGDGDGGEGPNSPEDIATAVFEVFLRRDETAPGGYVQQAAALHAPASAFAPQGMVEDISQLLAAQVSGGASVSVESGTNEDGVGFVKIHVTGTDGDPLSMEDVRSMNINDASEAKEDQDTTQQPSMLPGEDAPRDTAQHEDGEMGAPSSTTRSSQDGVEVEVEVATDDNEANNDKKDNDDDERSALQELMALIEDGGGDVTMTGGSVDELAASLGFGDVRGNSITNNENIVDITASNGNNNPEIIEIDVRPPGTNEGREDDASTLSSMGLGVVMQRAPATIEWKGKDAFTLVVSDLASSKDPSPPPPSSSSSSSLVATSSSSSDEAVSPPLERTGDDDGGDDDDDDEAAANRSRGRPAFSGRLDEIESLVRSAMGAAIAQGIGVTTSASAAHAATQSTASDASSSNNNDNNNNDITPSDGEGEVLGLQGRVEYTRIPQDRTRTDPLSGTFVGIFGPHGPEVVQLQRCMVEGLECVEALKLTGDPNVPAGEVCFRARIGKRDRISADVYPPELGVVQRYPGNGRVAREGFKHPKWVDGELLVLSPRGAMTKGADLGLLYTMDSPRGMGNFLVMFKRLYLEDIVDCMAALETSGGGQREKEQQRWW